MELDRTDFELLRLLQENVRYSNKQLAAAVGMAQSSCHERVKRLWSLGLVRRSVALLDARALGFSIAALFMIGVSRHEKPSIDRLLDDLMAIEEVQTAYLITGRYDIVVHVLARDMDDLKALAYEHFTYREEITRFETSIIYESRENLGIPLGN